MENVFCRKEGRKKGKKGNLRSYRRELTGRKGQEQAELEKNSLKEERKVTTWTCRENGPEERIPEKQGPPEEP